MSKRNTSYFYIQMQFMDLKLGFSWRSCHAAYSNHIDRSNLQCCNNEFCFLGMGDKNIEIKVELYVVMGLPSVV